jgi:hypothetical protein
MSSSIIRSLKNISTYYDDQMKEDEMGGSYRAHGG